MILNQIATRAPWTGRPRPADWPPLPAAADNTFNGLISVWDVPDGNRVALTATVNGGFTVDWGDGSTDTWTSGATAQHQYDYADTDLGTVTAGGCKVALVRVTPTTPGNSWTVFSLQQQHSALGATVTESGWLDINVTGSALTTLTISAAAPVVRLGTLWGAAFGSSIGSAPLAGTFRNCYSLASAPALPAGFNNSLTATFYNCYSLAAAPALPAGFNNSLNSTFYNCYSLAAAPALPAGFNNNLAYAFRNCLGLKTVTGYSRASDMTGAFTGCTGLESGALVGTRLSTSYASCNLSQSALNAIYTGLADLSAYTITHAVGNGTTATYTTSTAHQIIVGQAVTVTGINPAGYNVTAGEVTAIGTNTFTVTCTEQGSYVSGGAIAATSGQVVTVSGNWGAGSDDPTIATRKNWTVTV